MSSINKHKTIKIPRSHDKTKSSHKKSKKSTSSTTSSIYHGDKTLKNVHNNIRRCNEIEKVNNFVNSADREYDQYNNLINSRNSKSCFIQEIYSDSDIWQHVNSFKEYILKYNVENKYCVGVVYGGTAWSESFPKEKLNEIDVIIKENKINKKLRDVSFVKNNYDVFMTTNSYGKPKQKEYITSFLKILEFKINYYLFRHRINCNCRLEIDDGTSGYGTIISDIRCIKYRLILNRNIELQTYPTIEFQILDENDKKKWELLYNRKKRETSYRNRKIESYNGCNNELVFYIEIGEDKNIDCQLFKRYLIQNNEIYLNEIGCFIIQLYLSNDRKEKGINIDDIRRHYCINSIVNSQNDYTKQKQFYKKIMTPLEQIFTNDDYIKNKMYLYGFKKFNANVYDVASGYTNSFETFVDIFNNYILENTQSHVSIREYSNLLFIEINKYLVDNNYGLLAKAGGECMRYYIRDDENQVKTKDFDCKLFVVDNNIKNIVKQKILLLIIFSSVFFNSNKNLKNINKTFYIDFYENKYNITLNTTNQSNIFSSRILYDFDVPLFSLDLRILYTITKPKRLIHDDMVIDDDLVNDDDLPPPKKKKIIGGLLKNIKNYFVETPIDIAISNTKIKKENINKILVSRPNLPPILSLTYLKDDITHTLTNKKSYFQRLFAGKIKKDKQRFEKLNLAHEDIYLNNRIEYIEELDRLPQENIKNKLSEFFSKLLNYDTINSPEFDYTGIIHLDERQLFETTFALFIKANSILIEKKRFKTPFSNELLNDLIDGGIYDDDVDNIDN